MLKNTMTKKQEIAKIWPDTKNSWYWNVLIKQLGKVKAEEAVIESRRRADLFYKKAW